MSYECAVTLAPHGSVNPSKKEKQYAENNIRQVVLDTDMLIMANRFKTYEETGRWNKTIEVTQMSKEEQIQVYVTMVGPHGNKIQVPSHMVKDYLALGLSIRRSYE